MMKENFLVIPVLVDDRADKQFLVSEYNHVLFII
jgi:hypothetical protein